VAHDQDRNDGRLSVDPISLVSARYVNPGCEAEKAARSSASFEHREVQTHLLCIWPTTVMQGKAECAKLQPDDCEDPHGAKAIAESAMVDVRGHWLVEKGQI
jgi:hypothetical protein